MRSKYSPIARSTLASSSTSSSVSATIGLEPGADEHRECAGHESRLERRLSRHLAVQLDGTRSALGDLHAHRAAAPPPDAAAHAVALPVAQQQLEHRARALEHPVSIERHDIEPAVIG